MKAVLFSIVVATIAAIIVIDVIRAALAPVIAALGAR